MWRMLFACRWLIILLVTIFSHYLTDDTREGDRSVILYVASDALFINRDNECTFARGRHHSNRNKLIEQDNKG